MRNLKLRIWIADSFAFYANVKSEIKDGMITFKLSQFEPIDVKGLPDCKEVAK